MLFDNFLSLTFFIPKVLFPQLYFLVKVRFRTFWHRDCMKSNGRLLNFLFFLRFRFIFVSIIKTKRLLIHECHGFWHFLHFFSSSLILFCDLFIKISLERGFGDRFCSEMRKFFFDRFLFYTLRCLWINFQSITIKLQRRKFTFSFLENVNGSGTVTLNFRFSCNILEMPSTLVPCLLSSSKISSTFCICFTRSSCSSSAYSSFYSSSYSGSYFIKWLIIKIHNHKNIIQNLLLKFT